VIADEYTLARDALAFWSRHLPDGVSDDLAGWVAERTAETQILWQHLRRVTRSRGMWRSLTDVLEARDPTNPWTRHYDGVYFESQLMAVTRVVRPGPGSKASKPTALGLVVKSFGDRPELCRDMSEIAGIAVENRPALDPERDGRHLRTITAKLVPWRNKMVAHIDRGEKLTNLEWTELDGAIDGVVDVFARYAQRLTGVAFEMEFPEPVRSRWQAVFSEPLF
jgi:hypothetical protein